MIVEILITPDAFICADRPDPREAIKELDRVLFPLQSSSPYIAQFDVEGGAWRDCVGNKIVRIPDSAHRRLAMDLFQKIENRSLSRPPVPLNPGTEQDWIEAGCCLHRELPLDGIVVGQKPNDAADPVVDWQEFADADFWEKHANPRLVERDIRAQQSVLRGICTHADWVIIRFPYIQGGSDDEIATVKQIVQLTQEVPAGFTRSDICIHLKHQERLDPERLLRNVQREINHPRVKIELRDKKESFISRELIAGVYKKSGQRTLKKAMWWLTMGHVATRKREADSSGNTWALHSKKDADKRIKELGVQ